jgi:antitoxin component YwqK of YwqJK toxin-antitoxin module
MKTKDHIHYHKDGSIWAKGQMLGDQMHGYWEWYRKDGIIMRSGHFDKGVQVGEWTTYDKQGKAYKVTQMKVAGK